MSIFFGNGCGSLLICTTASTLAHSFSLQQQKVISLINGQNFLHKMRVLAFLSQGITSTTSQIIMLSNAHSERQYKIVTQMIRKFFPLVYPGHFFYEKKKIKCDRLKLQRGGPFAMQHVQKLVITILAMCLTGKSCINGFTNWFFPETSTLSHSEAYTHRT